ncbi:hypothetical protein N8E88_11395 (plasmid) [Phyllobacterium zundukense]|uniref:Uncharacterized protein n=1 Tax=Phyllobacterium zundukense TaxID=1867719 RepID=A0ACD4CYD6_9HYPH|nr:hypothetical protein N8E88_11395 [Phyllobacterium zundukense]
MEFPLEAAASETPNAMLALRRGRHLLQSGRTNRGWRRAVVANDGDMPNIGISIKIERWTRMVARYEAPRAMDVEIDSALV